MSAFIKNISYYLPEKILTNEELVKEFPEWSVGKIARKVGVNQRHIAAENETAMDMAVKAAEKLFTEHRIERQTIDFVLFCTQSPDYFLPTSACIIQDKLGLQTQCGALDFNLGCSGYIYGLSLAKGLISANIAKNVLLLTAETYTKHLHPKDKGNRTIFGDAATATFVSTDGFAKIGNFSFGTNGQGAENLIIHTGGMRHKEQVNDLHFDEQGNPVSSDCLYMNGTEIFNFTIDIIPALVENSLKINQLAKENVDLYVFHQANSYMLNYLRDWLEIEDKKFYSYLSEVGNTVSNTIPIAIYHAQKENRLKGNVLLAGFGVGYSWGGTMISINN